VEFDEYTRFKPSIHSSNKPINPQGFLIMKPFYRGNSYETPDPVQPIFASIDQPKIKLFYRGNTFDYTPPPEVVSEQDESDWPTIVLRYRGVTYLRKLQPPKPYQKPRAINWRWKYE
jgi:hypothetical protein